MCTESITKNKGLEESERAWKNSREKYKRFPDTLLVESCLPEGTLLAWERSRNHESTQNTRSLEHLIIFCKEVQGDGATLPNWIWGPQHNFRKNKASVECVMQSELTTASTLRFKAQNVSFHPPTAAWWERLIRVFKDLLKRTLGNAVLTYEELLTVLCECESIVNIRPLAYVSEDSDDLVPLTPAIFMMSNSSLDVADLDLSDFAKFQKRVKFRARLLKDLRRRFS
ncbi:uncharacterized protein TNCV_3118511 [Trichonephila clavipes]|uniref:Uncharacterized protein n=1 Tax=Trichonephila clavipes TaxID=2585209 RepID=A0A8X7BGE0_TRICX|nr:uncharacterized protein TNCV_3118511 [Trichonephila clavipes]